MTKTQIDFTMVMSKKDFIGGKRISRKQAYKGLGNPQKWGEFKKKIDEEFRRCGRKVIHASAKRN